VSGAPLKWGALAVLVLALWVAAYQRGARDTAKDWQGKWADQQVLQAKALAAASGANRVEEQRRQTANNEAGQNARVQTTAAVADAVVADAAGQRLHDTARQLANSASCAASDSAVAERSAAATRAAMVLSELFQRADQRAGELAKAYDAARIAGLACEAAYDGVRGVRE
jgi:hypothetical protein